MNPDDPHIPRPKDSDMWPDRPVWWRRPGTWLAVVAVAAAVVVIMIGVL